MLACSQCLHTLRLTAGETILSTIPTTQSTIDSANAAKQLTWRAVLLGALLSIVLAGANAYLGLFAGLTVSASIPAAVVSMAVLRWFKNSGVLENNIVQTAASAGESLAAGAIFTLPALILMGHWETFVAPWVWVICGVGGLLGVLMTIPLRHALIDNSEVGQALPFPEGQATAAVLRAGYGELACDGNDEEESANRASMRLLLVGAVVAACAKLATAGLHLWQGVAGFATTLGSGVVYVGGNFSPALLGVGYIVGLNVALLVFIGGVITWLVAVPVYASLFGYDAGLDPAAAAMTLWSEKLRFMGVGAMLVGGLWALWSMRGSLLQGLRRSTDLGSERGVDLPRGWLIGLGLLLAAAMWLLYRQLLGSGWAALPLTLVMLLAAFLFSAVASYMAGLVGSSNNPVSGVTLATILLTSLGLLLFVGDASVGAVAAILVGSVVCCAAAIGGDNMQDLKAGAILGATPWKQQLAQMLGVISAVFVLAPVLNLLLIAYGIGLPTEAHPEPLPAPQASLMAAVATGVFGGDLPWGLVITGMGVAIVVIVIDEVLRLRGSKVRAPVLAVAVGIYLPMKYSLPIAIGGLLAYVAQRRSGQKAGEGPGVLLAAGLITGEALMGILLAVPIVVSGKTDVLSIANNPAGAWPALLLFVVLALWFGRILPQQAQK